MKSILQILFVSLFLFINFNGNIQAQKKKNYEITSPDRTVKVIISLDEYLRYSVLVDDKIILRPSTISLKLKDRILGLKPRVSKISKRSVNHEITPVVKEKFKIIKDQYNELTLNLKKNHAVTFRVYNNGVAYRFSADLNKATEVISELLH